MAKLPNVSNTSAMYRSTLENLLRELLRASALTIEALSRIESKMDNSFSQLKQEIQNVSTSLSAQLDAATAAIQADVAAVSTEVTTLIAELTPGSTITQAQVDRLTAIDTALKAIPAAPTTTDTTAGASA